MAANNYQPDMGTENQPYAFSEAPPFYAKCPEEQQNMNRSEYATGHAIGSGLSGPGTHLEETTPTGIKPSGGRGRRKQRKKIMCPENLNVQTMKQEPMSEVDLRTMNEGLIVPGLQEGMQGDLNYQGNILPDDNFSIENQLFNSNTLDQVLSHKKMLLLQSPEIIEFLKKHRSSNDNRK